ncbi:uncharacterized protein LOC106669496 [Cimex lectularius]|uniref:Kazal-like domain-containing protein n=1 Tax=Cimex lectularius TaxID=79782 RepID=A0A8I6S211_CIMLE|nr:uncharacterized protein LOC106669496 [Cimex lectularius]
MSRTGILLPFALVMVLIVNVSANCNKLCPEATPCAKIRDPVCGLCEGRLLTYGNKCTFDNSARCSNNVFVHVGECNSVNLCNERCQLSPIFVCGYDNISETYQTFPSRCELEKYNVCYGGSFEAVSIDHCLEV